jgi:hypothetical protein
MMGYIKVPNVRVDANFELMLERRQ